jgi:transposase
LPDREGARVADGDLTLESLDVGALPIVRPILERLRVRDLLDAAFGKVDARLKLALPDTAMVIVQNIILSRHPLYGVPEWARRHVPELLGLEPDQIGLVNDDRLGRVLDRLFEADRRTAATRFAIDMAHAYRVTLAQLHNDSTTVTFTGQYPERPARPDGRRAVKVARGHNKDHRPDLKQLVWSFTVSADGGVPVHYAVYDGNTTDDRTHVDTWQMLAEIVGGNDFVYVADCKLCTKANMAYITSHGGHFITVLPRTRKEDARFKEWILHNTVPWEVIWKRPALRRKKDPPEVFEAVEAPEPSAEGYRIVWYRSSEKWKRDQRARDDAVQHARQELHRLSERVGRRKLKTRQEVQLAVDAILDETRTREWIRVELVAEQTHAHKQDGPGRPGKNTRYVRQTTTIYRPAVTLDAEAVRRSAAADGIFPLITDVKATSKTPVELLEIYKYQAFVEKRHEQFKTCAEVMPVNLKSVERIEGFLFLYFIALTVHALLERQLRQAMKARGIKSIPLYPEERECTAPTADKILELFEPLRRNRLFAGSRLKRTFWDPLSPAQQLVLELLNVPYAAYGQR